ncbi:MAG: hypothetical protein ACI849_000622 [Patiriisocius sp.]|jgi:hypothetical protein
MIGLKKLFIVTLFFSVTTTVFAQRGAYGDGNYNRIGIQGGYSLFDINTSDLVTESGDSFTLGFTTRGSFRNNFDLIYGINFISNKLAVKAGLPCGILDCPEAQFINYSIIGAQVNFLVSYNIIKHHLSIEAGPLFNINGKMKLDSDRFEDYTVQGYNTITARDIEQISTLNGAALIGITGGFEQFRINVNYQYGFTNTLGGLNDENLENQDFKGNTSNITIAGIIYF